MNDFVFQNKTKIYFGKDQLTHLGEEAAAFGKKVLLVYGGGSIKRIGLYDKVVDVLTKAGMTISELGGVEPNPRHTTVNKGVKICREEGIDVILAVGGGSTIHGGRRYGRLLGFGHEEGRKSEGPAPHDGPDHRCHGV